MSGSEPLARPCRHGVHVEVLDRVPDLLDVLRQHVDESPSFYWEDRSRGEGLFGLGSVHEIQGRGAKRFVEAGGLIDAVLASLQPDDEASAALLAVTPPRFVGGFAFAPEPTPSPLWREFPPLRLFLPARLWVTARERAWLITTSACDLGEPVAPVASGTASQVRPNVVASLNLQRERWRARVERVLAMVDGGSVEKIVLSRSQTDGIPVHGAETVRGLEHLRKTRPTCVSFCLSSGTTRFFGSTPEILARVCADRFETQALAGTAPRGSDRENDDANARRLLASDKNLREQAAVTGGIKAALAPLAFDLRIPDKPDVLRLPEALHLHTPIEGTLRRPTTALELAARVHPTPAVCGSPSQEAYRYLQCEEADRGWYAGAVGWISGSGDGSFAVALRSALADRQLGLTLWAGAGIVSGSRPDAEFEETEIKMEAVRVALAGGSR